ncbi:MAG: T9SS type A sorting domain-containing protein [Bacteroidota bacterium]
MKKTITFIAIALAVATSFYFLQSTTTSTPNDVYMGDQKMSKLERIDQAFELEYLKTVDPKTNTVPRERLVQAKAYTENILRQKGAIPSIVWEERGPDNVGGRTRAILFDANDASNNTVWAAGVGGGLWKSTNFLSDPPTWNQVDDFFDNIAVTSILQDPTNAQILYFGTGEGWFNGDAIRGLGIWKSTNSGTTWTQLSSTDNGTFHYVQDLIIDTNGNLYAATRSGLQRSTDGGSTWSQVMSGRFADLELGADNDIYATEGMFSTGQVWKSDATTHGTNLGANGNWVDITPSGSFRRIEIATAPSDANRVYILCHSSSDNNVSNIFRSDNASGNSGITWTSLPVPTIIDQQSDPNDYSIFTRNQAWYDLIAAVDPNNADIVYIGGVDALRSTNAGVDWTQITTWSLFAATDDGYGSAQNVHADHHMIVFAPGSSTQAIWGTDGGLDWTTDANNTVSFPSWTSKNNGYNVTQYYSCAASNEVSSNYFLAGAQDNGTQRYTSAGINSTTRILGGDGGYCHIDEDNSDIQIVSTQNNGFRVTSNAWGSSARATVPGGTFTSISDYDSKFNIMYAASSTSAFGFIKDVGTNNTVGTTTLSNLNQLISAITVSPNVDKRVYFGLRNGRILKVENADATSPSSTIITPSGASTYCSSIAVAVGNDDHLLATYSSYGVTSVYESMDGGSNWTSVEGNLPDMPVRWAVFNPNDSDQALLATEMGVWSADNLDGSSTDWGPTNSMLANTRVDMLQIRPADHLILAATHGKGLFTSDDLTVAKIQFASASTQLTESNSQSSCPAYIDANIPIGGLAFALDADATVAVSVDAASTAVEDIDFEVLNAPFTFTTSGGNQQNLTVRVYDDAIVESEESIILNMNLTNPGTSGAINGTLLQHTITISDNDFAPTSSTILTSELGSNSANSASQTPFRGSYEDERYQTLILASALASAGFKAGEIEELSFFVNSKSSSQPFSDFTIKIGQTTTTSLGSSFSNDASTTVYTDDYSTVDGWNNFVFNTPFTWDGTSNIIVETCFDNTSTTSADGVATYNAGSYTQTAYNRSNGASGCSLTDIQFTGNAPYVRLKVSSLITAETVLNASSEEYLGPNQTVYFYSQTDGEIIAKIENLSSHDYGCTTVTIDRAGTGAVTQANVETISKTMMISPTTNNPSGSYNITLYYTEAEISGFEAANTTGEDRNSLQLAKSDGPISSATQFTFATSTSTTIPSGDLAYTTMVNTGFSGFTLSGGTVLPVELLYFRGEMIKNQAVLSWETTSEINNEGFYLERSLDGVLFTAIDFIKGAGNSLVNQKYTYTDQEIKRGQTYYYRLKQMDFDGVFEYSSIIALDTKASTEMNVLISPNPSAGQVTLTYNLPQPSIAQIQLIDQSGRLIQTLLNESSSSGHYQLSRDLSHLEKGVYFIVLTTEKARMVKKLMLL